MHSRKFLIVTLAVCSLVSACSQFNTNLTNQTNSSLLTFLSPSEVPAGTSDFTITATGNGFTTGALILWNGAPLTTTLVSTTTLTAPVPAANVAAPGKVQVTVSIPGSAVAGASGTSASGTTELSNIIFFTVGAPGNAVPTITALTPSCKIADPSGNSGFSLTVTGTGFVNGSVVFWNRGFAVSRLTTFVSATSLKAGIAGTDVSTVGTAQVSVQNPPPGGGTSASVPFTITSGGTGCS